MNTIANVDHIEKLLSERGGNRDHPIATGSFRSALLRPAPITNSPARTESENAHPGAAVWVPVLILFALSVTAYFLFCAKATSAWPFAH
jgi:hypothetical protein